MEEATPAESDTSHMATTPVSVGLLFIITFTIIHTASTIEDYGLK